MMMIQMHDIVSTCMRRINNSNTRPSSAVLITWRWISSLAPSLSNTCTWSPQVTYFSHSSLLVSIRFLLLVVIRTVLREALPFCLLHIFQLIFWISAPCDVTKSLSLTRTPARSLLMTRTWQGYPKFGRYPKCAYRPSMMSLRGRIPLSG